MKLTFKLTGDFESLERGCSLLSKRLGISFAECGTPIRAVCGDHLIVSADENGYAITYSDTNEFFRGLALLCGTLRGGRTVSVDEKKGFSTRGMMFDVSRNAVYTVKTVHRLLEYMASMGLNMIMLYTEDTYEMEKYPDFGYMRGAYTQEEIKDIVDYASAFGIEVIPCLQTLGHFESVLRWPSMKHLADSASVLMVGKDETYELIEEIFKTCAACFTSRRIHIGFDEAFGLGRGNYLHENGFRKIEDIYFEHLARVCEIAKKYGFTPMIWNDMIFKLNEKQAYLIDGIDRLDIPQSIYGRYPDNTQLVYYNYGGAYKSDDKRVTKVLLDQHDVFGRPYSFCGGVWTWFRLCTCLKKTYEATKRQLLLCREHDISTVFGAVWGCGMHQFNVYSTLPGLQIWAELIYHANADMDFIWDRFETCTGYRREEWKHIYFDDFSDEDLEKHLDMNSYCINPSFQHLYNDLLTGLFDKTLSGFDFKQRYAEFNERLGKVDGGEMKPMFDRYKALYRLLYVKCDIGIRLRKAYQAADREELLRILEDMERLPGLCDDYHKCVEEDWYADFKPFGYSGQDMYLGMLKARIQTAISVLKKYLDGTYESLPELACEIRYFRDVEKPLTEVLGPTKIMSAAVFEDVNP